MGERLAEIKKSYRNNVGLEGRTIFWLISEVERLKVERDEARQMAMDAHAEGEAGMERAAKIVNDKADHLDDDGRNCEIEAQQWLLHDLAADIQAEAKQ